MPKPRRIQKLEDIGAKALAEYEGAVGQQRERAARVAEREMADALRDVADRQGWAFRQEEPSVREGRAMTEPQAVTASLRGAS